MASKRAIALERFAMKWRVPVGFWFHFVTLWKKRGGDQQSTYLQKVLMGIPNHVERIRPDFVKIMSDGFFLYPSNVYNPKTKHSGARLLLSQLRGEAAHETELLLPLREVTVKR